METECILEVHVIPNSKEFKIIGFDSWSKALKIKIKSPPEKGKANKEVIDELKKEFNCGIEIINGLKTRNKKIKVLKSLKEIQEKIKL
ncbi:MAG: YggU family protein [Candidatus Diapherotrites archaeon]|nr:YggU family protein [Candidatus Diapherotrites archaeon]